MQKVKETDEMGKQASKQSGDELLRKKTAAGDDVTDDARVNGDSANSPESILRSSALSLLSIRQIWSVWKWNSPL